MKKSSLFSVWGILYIICAGLGFIQEPQGAVRIFLTVISVLFFVPPGLLLMDAVQTGDKKTCRRIRLLAALSLGLTLLAIIAGILSVRAPESVGMALHVLLVLVSAPMLCSGYWVLSLFLWAMLLVGSLEKKK